LLLNEVTSSALPFYNLTKEDHTAFQLHHKGKIDRAGVVTEGVKENVFVLSPETVRKIKVLCKERISLEGRSNRVPLDVEVSIQEISQATGKAAQQVIQQTVSTLLCGGAIWRLIEKDIYRIFNEWCGSEMITSLFKWVMKSTPNDYDWQFRPKSSTDPSKTKKIISKGMVELISGKVEKKKDNPYIIVAELAKLRNKITKLPPDSYPRQILDKHPIITHSHKKLYKIFTRAFGFQTAVDLPAFSLRTIGLHDCVFPSQSKPTTTPINSLYLDVSPLIRDDDDSEISLKSFLGPQGPLQAISDRNLSLLTFHPNLPANHLDFARTLSSFTEGGRCYQKGWLDKTLKALREEVKNQQKSYSEVLAKQLIRRVKHHHHNEVAALISMTFNASAILLWKEETTEKEIQKLWQLIFGYVDTIEDKHPKYHPIMERIIMEMRDPEFKFRDLFAQMLVSTSIDHFCRDDTSKYEGNSTSIDHFCRDDTSKYEGNPTQTEEEIFHQIKMKFSQQREKKSLNFTTLLFPYDLPRAISHLDEILYISEPLTNALARIHDCITNRRKPFFGFGKSKLKHFARDPRRKRSDCIDATLKLLKKQHMPSWRMGYMLALSFLAGEQDSHLLYKLLKSLVTTLRGTWASDEFKKEVVETTKKVLTDNHIPIPDSCLDGFINSKRNNINATMGLIKGFMATGTVPFVDIALEYLEEIDTEIDQKERVTLYRDMVRTCLPSPQNMGTVAIEPLNTMISRVERHRFFGQRNKFNIFLELYANESVIADHSLESRLFDGILTTLDSIKKLTLDKESREKTISILSKTLKRKKRGQNPFQILRYMKAVFRLNILNTAKPIQNFWDFTGRHLPTETNLAISYQKSRRAIAIELGCWERLKDSQKQTFDEKLIELGKKSGDPNVLRTLSEHLENSEKNLSELHQILTNSLKKALNENIKEETENILVLFDEWIQGDFSWNSRELLLQFLTQLSLNPLTTIYTVQRIISDFRQKHEQNNRELISFYLECARETEGEFRETFLTNLIPFFTDPKSSPKRSDDEYINFINLIIECNYSVPLNQKQAHHIILELHNREIWMGLYQVIQNIPLFPSEPSEKIVMILIDICHDIIKAPEPNLATIEKLILPIPMRLVRSEEHDKMFALTDCFFHHALNRQDYSTARQILEKQRLMTRSQNKEFFARAFHLLHEIASQGDVRDAWELIRKLQIPIGYEDQWLELFKVFLHNQHISICLKMMKTKRSVIGVDHPDFKLAWTEQLINMLRIASESEEYKNKFIQEQMAKLYKIINELIWSCQPNDPELWSQYINLIVKDAPTKVVEDALKKVVEDALKKVVKDAPTKVVEDALKYLVEDKQKTCKKYFWHKILTRLAEDGSKLITKTDCWWKTACAELEETHKEEKKDLPKLLIQGTKKALEIHSGNKIKPNQIKKILAITDTIYKESERSESFDRQTLFEKSLVLDFISLFLKINDDKDFGNGEDLINGKGFLRGVNYLIGSSYLGIKTDPIIEAKVVKLINEFLIKSLEYRGGSEINSRIVMLIRYLLLSNQIDEGDLFLMLKHLNRVPIPPPHLRMNEDGTYAVKAGIDNIPTVVNKILDYPWNRTLEVTPGNKKTLCESIHRLWMSKTHCEVYEAKKILLHRNFWMFNDSQTISKKIRKRILEIKKPPVSTQIQGCVSNANALLKEIALRVSLGQRHLLPEEKRVLVISCGVLTCTILCVIGVAYVFFSAYLRSDTES